MLKPLSGIRRGGRTSMPLQFKISEPFHPFSDYKICQNTLLFNYSENLRLKEKNYCVWNAYFVLLSLFKNMFTKGKKVKWSRYRPGVAQRVGRGIALLFHDRGTRRGWVVSSTPRPHFTPGKDLVRIVQETGWAPGPVWTGGKSRPHRDSIPDHPARSQSLYRLSYPAHKNMVIAINILRVALEMRTERKVGSHIKCSGFSPDFNQCSSVSTDFKKSPHYQFLWKSDGCYMPSEWRMDRYMDVVKVIDAILQPFVTSKPQSRC